MILFLALYSFGGLILAGLAVPFILHKIPHDSKLGFRSHSTNNDPIFWYQLNSYAGKRFLVVGLGTAIGASILYYLTPTNVEAYALSCLGLFLALFLWAMITSFLFLRSQQ